MPQMILEELLEENEIEMRARGEISDHPQHVYGVMDRKRWPQLAHPTFEVREMSAAVAPDNSYQLLLPVITGAQTTLDIYIYDFTSGALRDAVISAAARGVQVRIQYDTVGPTTKAEREVMQALAKTANISVKLAPSQRKRSVFTVCHQKMAVADQSVVTFGSGNWGDTAYPPKGPTRRANREWMIRTGEKAVAQWYTMLFEKDWEIPVNDLGDEVFSGTLPDHTDATVRRPAATSQRPEPFPGFDLPSGEIASLTPLLSPDNYQATVRALIEGAQSRIWLQQQYLKATTEGAVYELMNALMRARERKVEIRIIGSMAFDSGWNDTVRTVRAFHLEDTLRSLNLNHFVHCHNKGILVDHSSTVVSSTNWSDNSVTAAREIGAVVQSPTLNAYFSKVFTQDWENAWPLSETPGELAALEAASQDQNADFVTVPLNELR